MSELAKYEKMLKDNNAAVKKLTERGKQIAAVIKLIKSLEADEPQEANQWDANQWDAPEPLINDENGTHS